VYASSQLDDDASCSRQFVGVLEQLTCELSCVRRI
jgi:hypothetical protein